MNNPSLGGRKECQDADYSGSAAFQKTPNASGMTFLTCAAGTPPRPCVMLVRGTYSNHLKEFKC